MQPRQQGRAAGQDELFQWRKILVELGRRIVNPAQRESSAIEKADGRLEDVIRTRVMLTDISTWESAAKAHGEIFASIRPACTFVEVSGFVDPDWLVELEADCVIRK